MNEMVEPSSEHRQKTYYHGTGNLDNAINIFKNGFKAREITSRKLAAPVKGKVYMTSDLRTAVIYAMEGVMMGSKESRNLDKNRRYGVVFEISGSELGDIQPDEDSVGEILKGSIDWFDKGKKPFYDFKWPDNMDEIQTDRHGCSYRQ